MFTGIVDHTARIGRIAQTPQTLQCWIESAFKGLTLGESICTDGVCLTVAEIEGAQFRVDVSPETCDRSRFGSLKSGDVVNVERSLRVGDRMGGHYVTGHVDQTMELSRRYESGEYVGMQLSGVLTPHKGYLTEKGSVTVNGVSLTVNAVLPEGFEVMLIPHTLQRTNLDALRVGDRVNIEFDWMSKVIAQQVQRLMEQRV